MDAKSPLSTGRGKSFDVRSSRSGKTLSSPSSSSASTTASSPASANSKVKKKKKRSSAGNKTDHYTNYIFRLLRLVKPGVKITRRAMSIMNSFVLDAFERIAVEAGTLCTRAKKDTLTANEVRTAVRLVLPGDLAKHAIMEGVAAVQTFTNKESSPARRPNNAI